MAQVGVRRGGGPEAGGSAAEISLIEGTRLGRLPGPIAVGRFAAGEALAARGLQPLELLEDAKVVFSFAHSPLVPFALWVGLIVALVMVLSLFVNERTNAE